VVWAVSRPFIAASRQTLPSRPNGTDSALRPSGILADKGVEMARQGRWLEAVEILDTAARAGENTAMLHRTLGRCLGELGWVDDAIQEYEQAVKLEPSYFNTYINLATAYRSLGKRTEALKTLDRARRVLESPDLLAAEERYARPAAPMLEELSEAYARLGEFEDSIQWALRAQTADPTRTRGYLLAAKSYFVLKQAEKAIPLLQKACSASPTDADSHYTLALALRARPSFPHNLSAREHLIEAIKFSPDHAPALYQLGMLCMERKEWDNALAAFRRAYDLRYEPGTLLWSASRASAAKGDNLEKAFFLGQYHEYIGQITTALPYFQKLAASSKYRRIGIGFVARAQAKLGRLNDAIVTLQKAIVLDPRSSELRRQLAAVYDRLHIVTKRVAALEEAAKLDGSRADRDLYELGRIALEVGNYDEAEKVLEKAISLDPSISQYHYSLGQTMLLRAELGDRLNRAIGHLEVAQKLAPDSVNVHDFLSSAYIKAQRWQDAAVSLHRSANISAQNEVLYFRLNQVYKRLGNQQESKRAQLYYQRLRKEGVSRDLLTRQVKAKPNDAAKLAALGDHLLRMRDYGGAKRQFERALALRPNVPQSHERLATIFGELAQPEGQLTHLKKLERLIDRSGRFRSTAGI
jgi:tetratricopeptide (TPR) repeat protein